METKARFDLPVDLRNEIARMEILGEHSAGAVSLSMSGGNGAASAIVSGETADAILPLLSPNYYLNKALAPFADVREATPGTPDPIGVAARSSIARYDSRRCRHGERDRITRG